MDLSRLTSTADYGPIARQMWNLYAKLDNRPGDLDRRGDRVELSDGGSNIQAVLTSHSVVERRQAPGSTAVALTEVKLSGFFRAGGATQVSRTPKGLYMGDAFEHHQNGELWPNGSYAFYRWRQLSSDEAQLRFLELESKFRP